MIVRIARAKVGVTGRTTEDFLAAVGELDVITARAKAAVGGRVTVEHRPTVIVTP